MIVNFVVNYQILQYTVVLYHRMLLHMLYKLKHEICLEMPDFGIETLAT